MEKDDLIHIIETSAKIMDGALDTAEYAAGIIFVEGVKALSRKYPRRKIEASVGMGSLAVMIERHPPATGPDYFLSGYTEHDDKVLGAEFLAELIEMEQLFEPTYENRPIVPDMFIELLAGEIIQKR